MQKLFLVSGWLGHDRISRQTQVREDSLDHLALRDRCQQPQAAAALGASQNVQLERAPQQICPRMVARAGGAGDMCTTARLVATRAVAHTSLISSMRGSVFECFVLTELRKQFLHHGERPPLFFWRDTHGHEVDVVIDLGSRRLPVEIKSGATVAANAFAGLDFFCGVSGDNGGLLVYAGDESYARGHHRVRPWWACS